MHKHYGLHYSLYVTLRITLETEYESKVQIMITAAMRQFGDCE